MTTKKSVKTLPIGTPVTWRYRGEKYATGVIVGIAKKGTTPGNTEYRIRSTTANDTKGMVFKHYGRELHRLPKSKGR